MTTTEITFTVSVNEICVPVDFTFGEIEDIEVFVDSEAIGLNY